MNKAIVIGNLGADPELSYLEGGAVVCRLRLATTEKWTDAKGAKQERTEWHRINVWGKMGENCAKYNTKGSKLAVEGQIQTRDYEDKDGQRRFVTEIRADRVEFLGGGQGNGRDGAQSGGYGAQSGAQGSEDSGGGADDDIPFDQTGGYGAPPADVQPARGSGALEAPRPRVEAAGRMASSASRGASSPGRAASRASRPRGGQS